MTCSRCGLDLPEDAFAVDRSKRLGRKAHCKACDNARCRGYYAENRERVIARCSRTNRERRSQRPPRAEETRACRMCREPFSTSHPGKLYCSPTCAKRSLAESRNAHWHRRRVRAGAALTGKTSRVELLVVAERDGHLCHLCGLAVDMTVRSPHPLSPTRDHLIPIAAGGEHTYENVRLAHFRCNVLRRDKPIELVR